MSQKMAIQEQQLQDLTRKESLRNINEKSMSSKRKKEDMNLGEDEELGFDMTKELLEAMVSKLTQPLVAMCQSIQDRQELFSIQVAKLIESQSKSPPQTKIIQEIKEVQRTSVKSAANKHKVMTYAEAIAKSPLAPENIRNINITGTPEEVSRISTILRVQRTTRIPHFIDSSKRSSEFYVQVCGFYNRRQRFKTTEYKIPWSAHG